MIEAILFDFDGTLTDFVASDITSLRLLHTRTGSAVSFDDFLDTAVEEIMKFHAMVDDSRANPLRMHEFRLKNTFAHYNMEWHDEYVQFYRSNLVKLCVPFDGVKELLSNLHQKVKTGMISNAYDGLEQRERIRNAGIESFFDAIVISGEIGIYKPDPGIFMYALDQLKVPPQKAVYVGDSALYDITGAKSAGLKTVLVGKHTSLDSNPADFTASGIDELQEIIFRLIE